MLLADLVERTIGDRDVVRHREVAGAPAPAVERFGEELGRTFTRQDRLFLDDRSPRSLGDRPRTRRSS